MLQEKQFLVDLKRHFRLNIYEAKIWAALLSRGIASAGELADISGVPRSRCYDVLESLEKKGFIIMKIGKPIKYLAISPEVILDRVKKNLKEECDELALQMEKIKDTDEFKELELLHKTGVKHVDISNISKSIIGRASISRNIKSMMMGAKSSIAVVAAQEHSERIAKLVRAVSQGLAKKSIKPKFYTAQSKVLAKKLQNADLIEYNAGSSFITVDSREMIFIVSNQNVAPDYEVAVWINSPFFVNAVNILFVESLK